MCLWADKERINGAPVPKRQYAWKVVRPDLRSQHYHTGQPKGYWRVGRVVSVRSVSRQSKVYTRGIHVFTHKKDAVFSASTLPGFLKVIRVQVAPKDWVAEGDTHAVYKRVKRVCL